MRTAPHPASAPPRPAAPGALDGWRLLQRATFGPTPEELDRLLTMGREAWLEEQLAPATIDDSALDATLAAYPWLGDSAAQLRAAHPGGGWSLSRDLRAVRLLRAQRSRRQLLERVVELWTDRFNVPFSAQDANFLRPVYDREAVRAHALGAFPALLRAVTRSPAMLGYLDADESTAGVPNENLARELLELHSVGSAGGYGEGDVQDLARVLTGWGYVRHWQPGEFGVFRFDAGAHDTGAKSVLGLDLAPGGGEDDGERVLAHLGVHAATARSVALAVARHFVSYEPPAWLLAALEAAYVRTDGDLVALVRLALSEPALAAATPKVKRPLHFAVSFLRATDAPLTGLPAAISALEGLGQPSFDWPTPDGYPDQPEAWAALLAPRWRWAASVTTGWNSWCALRLADLEALVQGAPRAEWPRRVAARLLGVDPSTPELTAELAHFLAGAVPPRTTDLADAFELAASSPPSRPTDMHVTTTTRRRFMGGLAGGAGLVAFGRPAQGAAPAAGRDVLVFVALRGGLDGLSLCVPHGDPGLGGARPSLAVPVAGAIPLDGFFALSPAAAALEPAYRDGHLAFVQAVGSPDPTRSHFDATERLEAAVIGATGIGEEGGTGWIGRSLARSTAARPGAPRGVALGPVLPRALVGGPSSLPVNDAASFVGYGRPETAAHRREALRRMAAGGAGADLSTALVMEGARATIAALDAFAGVDFSGHVLLNGADYPATAFGRRMRDTAALVRSRIGVDVIQVDFEGWDDHAQMGPVSGALASRIDELSRALAAFRLDLGADLDRVTLVGLSEFGRRVDENGSGGTDHGRGGLALVMGGSVEGGQVLGSWPGLDPAQLDGGALQVTTDYRQVLAEVIADRFDAGLAATAFPGLSPAYIGVTR